MQKFKIYGPPGTGKTTYLLSVLEKELSVCAPEECSYVSFTRKGTYEGVQRAKKKFDLHDDELPFFRTIHSLCFSNLGMKKHNVINKFSYIKFSEKMGMKFIGHYSEEFMSTNDVYLFAEQVARNNPLVAASVFRNINLKTYKWVAANYKKFKQQTGVYDYTDMLEMYLDRGEPLPVKVAIIDEAQDLTKLQWLVVRKMFSNCERLYVAGDDDQAIYEWSGADVGQFLNFNGDTKVLSKSYRLPKAIHRQAQLVAKGIATRAEKEFASNGEDGQITVTTSWSDIPFNENESTLVLARNNCYLDGAEAQLQDIGLTYKRKGASSVESRILKAIKAYEAYRNGTGTLQAASLYSLYFRDFSRDLPWYETLNLPAAQVAYYRKLIAANPVVKTDTKINLETIHSSKGSEADHVVLALDITNSVFENLQDNPDSELRCLYVGVTRAKKKLTVKLSETRYSLPRNTFLSRFALEGQSVA